MQTWRRGHWIPAYTSTAITTINYTTQCETRKARLSQVFYNHRRYCGFAGERISLQANHFKVSVKYPDGIFYHQTYSYELAETRFAFDGRKGFYTVGPLRQNQLEFPVVIDYSFAKRGCLLVRRSFFHDDRTNATDVGNIQLPPDSSSSSHQVAEVTTPRLNYRGQISNLKSNSDCWLLIPNFYCETRIFI